MKVRFVVAGATLLGVAGGTLLFGRDHDPRPRLILTVTDLQRGPDAPSAIVATSVDGNPGWERVLSRGLHSARSPHVSPDGARVVFAGRRTASDPWSLWETSTEGPRPRQLATGLEATGPLYLGPDRIAFSGRRNAGEGWALFAIDRDGRRIERLTHHPGDDGSASILRDGRIVFSHRSDGDVGPRRLFTVRPDGTGVELLYEAPDGATLVGRAIETADRKLLVVQMDASGARRAVAVDPVGYRDMASIGPAERIHAVTRGMGVTLVAYAATPGARSGVYALRSEGAVRGVVILRDTVDVIDVMAADERPAPPALLSVVDPAKRIGWIYGIDVDLSDLPSRAPAGRSARLRVSSVESVWGEVDVEVDGSFFVELPADTPFRLETLDAEGNLVRGPSDWLWVRPGEHRGCIGCHEPSRMAPPNRVPIAVDRPATRLTAHDSERR